MNDKSAKEFLENSYETLPKSMSNPYDLLKVVKSNLIILGNLVIGAEGQTKKMFQCELRNMTRIAVLIQRLIIEMEKEEPSSKRIEELWRDVDWASKAILEGEEVILIDS